MVKNNGYTKNEKTYQEILEGKSEEESNEVENTIKIAGRRIEIYTQTILNKLQKFDQIEICVLDTYLDRALHIIKQWEAVGITPLKEFRSKGGTLRFQKREEDIVTKEGKRFRKPVNRITLTKQPDQFRFTKI